MALTSGFFNSLNGDRLYSAPQLGAIFDGIIYDGVYQAYGSAFAVTALGALNVSVGIGRAWFNHIWVLNDAALGLTLSASHATLNRYDEIILQIDTSDGVRMSSISVVYGTAASSPSRPTLTNTATLKQYSLAYIYRAAASSSITQGNITTVVGTAATPWATSVLANNISFTQLIDTAGFYGLHAQVFRGANLGTALTAGQKANIQNGTFADLWLGDYWVIGGVTYRIVDINYWKGLGDTPFNSNHLVIMPDSALYQAKMHGSSSTSGGYVGSQMYTTNLATAKTTINAAFPSSVLSHRDFFSNAVSSGSVSSCGWYDSTVNIPNETQFFGVGLFGTEKELIAVNQFNLFAKRPELRISSNAKHTWLNNIVNSTDYAGINEKGFSDYFIATDSGVWVRPVFCIG